MLTFDVKRKINTLRDILVGKVPDPKAQVEQITIALIYKFMDDMDIEGLEFGGTRQFFTGEYEKYAWTEIMIGLLNEQVTGVAVLEGEHNQVYSLVQVHEEAGHVGVGDGDGIARLDLVDEQGDDAAAGAHDVAVAGAADGGAAALGSHTGVGVDDVLHHGLGDTHSVDGVGCLIGGQADDTLDTSINSGVQHIISADDVGLDSLHGEELAGRNLFQSGSVEDVVNTGHCVTDGLRVADIADVELHLLCSVRVLGLKLMTHIVLLLLVTGEDTDLLQIGIQKVLQNGGTKRTSTTSDHKGCVIKCRHFYSSSFHLI